MGEAGSPQLAATENSIKEKNDSFSTYQYRSAGDYSAKNRDRDITTPERHRTSGATLIFTSRRRRASENRRNSWRKAFLITRIYNVQIEVKSGAYTSHNELNRPLPDYHV
jgi:hypothetical protein